MKSMLSIVLLAATGARESGTSPTRYLNFATGASTPNVPMTIACWVMRYNTNSAAVVVSVNSDTTSRAQLETGTVGDVQASVVNSAGSKSGASITLDVINTWHHFVATFGSDTSRAIWTNGVFGATNATSRVLTSPDRIVVGARVSSGTIGSPFRGAIAELGVWNVELNSADIAQLAAGAKPYRVRPQSLVFYAPLWGDSDPEQNLKGISGTLTNSPAKVAHPRIF